jgi:hypothetical protein
MQKEQKDEWGLIVNTDVSQEGEDSYLEVVGGEKMYP